MQVHARIKNHNDDTIKTSEDTSLEKYTSHFIWKVCVWEGVGDRTELPHIDPHSYGHQRCVFLVLQACSNRSPGAHSAGCCSLYHILSPTGLVSKLNRGSPGPLLLDTGFLYCILSPTGFQKLTDFLSSPSYIIVQPPTQYLPITGHRNVSLPPSLEWHVWSSSSGNNCHAVHRSLSSVTSVCDCNAGFYLVPYCQLSPPTWSLPITGHRNVSLPPSLEWHFWAGRRSIYNTSWIAHKTTWIWPRKGNFKRETESLLIAIQNNDIKPNYIKANIDKTQQNR